MFKILCISIILIPALLAAQPNGTEEHALEILNNWNRLESKFIEKANERLLYFLNEDSILKENFLSGDSSKYKKLRLIVRPLLKFKKEAVNYTDDREIFNLIEYDTINYQNVAQFYLDDSLVFKITRGHSECDFNIIASSIEPIMWCPGDNIFYQYFYFTVIEKECFRPYFVTVHEPIFLFYIDYFYEGFYISEQSIKIYPNFVDNKQLLLSENPKKYIRVMYQEDWIRHCAKECPAGVKKPEPKP